MDDKEYSNLPDPYSMTQRRLMVEEMQDAAKLVAAKGGSKDDYAVAVMEIVGRWSARAARLYASNRIEDLERDLDAHFKSLQEVIEKLRAEVVELREEITLLQTQLSILELRRQDAAA